MVLEKDGEDQLDRSCEKLNATENQEVKKHTTDDAKKE